MGRFAVLIIVGALFVGGSSCASEAPFKATDSVQVGLLLPFTGSIAGLGDIGERASEVTAQWFNDAGGVHNRPVKLAKYDTESSPEGAAAAAEQLFLDGHETIVGTLFVASAASVLPVVIDHEGIFLTGAASAPLLEELDVDSGRLFRTVPSLRLKQQRKHWSTENIAQSALYRTPQALKSISPCLDRFFS